MYMHYSSSIVGDGSKYSFLGTMNVNFIMGPDGNDAWKLLRNWNALDPVSEEEIKRNEVAFKYQGNRNPFIDHPSYADLIWG
jgi:endonuclease I